MHKSASACAPSRDVRVLVSLPDPCHHGCVGIQGFNSPPIAPALALRALAGLEQDSGFQKPLRWAFFLIDQRLQTIAFCFVQFAALNKLKSNDASQ